MIKAHPAYIPVENTPMVDTVATAETNLTSSNISMIGYNSTVISTCGTGVAFQLRGMGTGHDSGWREAWR